MKYYAIGIDLAKNVFQVCGVNQRLKSQFNRKVKRIDFLAFMAIQEPTDVYMEACYSSHYWARKLAEIGHNPHLIPAQHVKPFVRGNKNDHNDAVAIIEASQRPFIKFVPSKTEHQQEISSLHRIRERLVKSKTAVSNQTRGLLSEFGVIFDQGQDAFCKGMITFINNDNYSARLRSLMADQFKEYNEFLIRIKTIEKELITFIESSPSGKILMSIPGIGIIIASAILAAIDKGQAFNNPREFAVWLGLTPQQYASGDTSRMGSITKRGDRYLRKQLIHGARTVVCRAKNKPDLLNVWACKLRENKSFNKTTVAMAHRLARLVWILLQRQELYKPQLSVQLS
jgi:transposase